AKVGGKWWLVDPDGALFLSLGIDVVTPHEATIITGRESMFTGLPRSDEPLGPHFGTVRQIHSGPIKDGSTFNFYAANLERTYGPDFFDPWRERTLSRLKSWGFNTVANWSDHRLYRNGKVPYVATVTVNGNHARQASLPGTTQEAVWRHRQAQCGLAHAVPELGGTRRAVEARE